MLALLGVVLTMLVSPFKSKSRLEAENAVLQHQLIVLRRKVKGRVRLTRPPTSLVDFKFVTTSQVLSAVLGDEGWHSFAIAPKALLIVHVKIQK